VTVNYGDLNIYATPAPGAAALVGLAGLMARRRRA
jgi:xanthosine utilization system XapX-like protein